MRKHELKCVLQIGVHISYAVLQTSLALMFIYCT